MTTALDRLRYEPADPNNQDMPMESIKDLLGDLVDDVESEMSNGGTQPITREQLHSPSVVTVDGNQGGAALLWEKLDGDDLLDLTDPSSPVVIEGGAALLWEELFRRILSRWAPVIRCVSTWTLEAIALK